MKETIEDFESTKGKIIYMIEKYKIYGKKEVDKLDTMLGYFKIGSARDNFSKILKELYYIGVLLPIWVSLTKLHTEAGRTADKVFIELQIERCKYAELSAHYADDDRTSREIVDSYRSKFENGVGKVCVAAGIQTEYLEDVPECDLRNNEKTNRRIQKDKRV